MSSHHTFWPVELGAGEPDRTPRVLVVCPGNGTRYLLVLTPIRTTDAARALGSRPGSTVVALWPGDPRRSASMVLGPEGHIAPSYIAEKLRVPFDDAAELAVILGGAVGRSHSGSQS